jgi:glycosyltransferase involved in cell wall biosynthesis
MAKVSVLVAVYNAEAFLSECLDSLLGQTLHDIQVVCVDDASTDASPTILDEYAAQDARIKVLHLEHNLGVAHARNAALTVADGEYICMLDADDWFAEDALQKAVEVFDSNPLTDCVLFSFVLAYPVSGGVRYEDYPCKTFEVLTGMEACELSLSWQIHGIYLVRSSIQKKYPYDTTCRLYSDDNTTRIHYAVSREVRCCSGTYYYLQHAQSGTHKATVRRFDMLRARESLYNSLSELAADKRLLREVMNLWWLSVIDCYMYYHCCSHELSVTDREHALYEMHRAWKRVDRKLLNKKTTAKLGYRPLSFWLLFRLEEWVYFTLRGWMGRN